MILFSYHLSIKENILILSFDFMKDCYPIFFKNKKSEGDYLLLIYNFYFDFWRMLYTERYD